MKKPLLSALFILVTSLSAVESFASALVIRNDARRTLRVIARMVYSGPALTEALAEASTDEITRMWNDYPVSVSINGTFYRVVFEIDHVIAGTTTLTNPDSCAYNFISIQDKVNAGDRSFYYALGSRRGVFYTSDDLGLSTTAAHEFGHGIMLEHNPMDQREAFLPGIMFARGTWVKPQYQYNPNVAAGTPGGTVNPWLRKVRGIDIDAIPFISNAHIDEKTISCLGEGLPQKI